jgi:hypothetical protein
MRATTETIQLPILALRDYQKPVWNAFSSGQYKRGVTVWPRRNGKDLVAINLIAALAMQRVGTYYYIAPFYNQVRQIIWEGIAGTEKKFIDYIPHQLVIKKSQQEMRLTLRNNSTIKLCGSDNIDSIVGTNPIGIVLTEFSLHKPEVWHYLRPILAENGGWALFNGTPRGLNHFFQLAHLAEKDPLWFYQFLTRDDTGIPTMEAIEADRASGMPESLIQQEYYCSWSASSEQTLIPLELITPAINRPVNVESIQSFPRIIGVDPAFAVNGDEAVIARRQGPLLHPLERYQGLAPMALASRVADLINEWHPDVVFVDAGRGEGIISRLDQLGYGALVVPVNFGGRTFSDLYHRKKDEIWCKMKNWLADPTHPASLPDDEKLFADLSAPTFTLNDRGFIQIESKTQLRSRGIGSTDCADAVAVTFAEDVAQDPMQALTRATGQAEHLQDIMHLVKSIQFGSANLNYDALQHLMGKQYNGHQ